MLLSRSCANPAAWPCRLTALSSTLPTPTTTASGTVASSPNFLLRNLELAEKNKYHRPVEYFYKNFLLDFYEWAEKVFIIFKCSN
jgi:hypothetical protein